jgi:uncharacterized protein
MDNLHLTSLSGTRIWLSGSIPKDAKEEESQRLIEFTGELAAQCFFNGAYLIHGCHPSLISPLLSAAKDYRESTERKATLRLIASFEYLDNGCYAGREIDELERESEFLVTSKSGNRDLSLTIMRDRLASESDVLIAIGGKWWQDSPNYAGVPSEFNLAIQKGIPSFLLGGLGGATTGYLQKNPEILNKLRNGMDLQENESLAQQKDITTLVTSILEQVVRLPLRRQETSSGQPFRILCLDGGGIRGVFTAAVLARWELMTGLNVSKHFDLIVGTSTGGILAIGLGLGLSAQEMVNFYRSKGSTIFPMMNFWQKSYRSFRWIVKEKFDSETLKNELRLAYGTEEKSLKDSSQRLLITSYNTTSDNILYYRTAHQSKLSNHDHLLAVDVALATSAAPSFFEEAIVKDISMTHGAIDGGIWANCPVLAALAEAVGVLEIPLDRIQMLSIGTTSNSSIVGVPKLFKGLLGWMTPTLKILMKAQIQASVSQAEQLLGSDHFLRIDDSAQCNGLDDVNAIDTLICKGKEIGEKDFEKINKRFINGIEARPWRES